MVILGEKRRQKGTMLLYIGINPLTAALVLAILLVLLVPGLALTTDGVAIPVCPVPVDNSTRCVCQYGDITCRDTPVIPRFTSDGNLYRSIDLTKQSLKEVPEASFFHLKVRKIILDFNPIGDALNVNAFAGVDSVLEELSLGQCKINNMREMLLIGMNKLRVLNLWGNTIRHIPPGMFQGTPYLEELYLWGNRLERLDEHMFAGLSKLRRLDLDRNRINEIRNNTFRHLRNLEVLHLGENNIFTIYGHTFRFLYNLKVLNLDRNGLKYIFGTAFHELHQLLALGLQNNEISFIVDGTFRDLRNLNILWLQNNKIDLVWSKSFTGLVSLQKLFLSGNQIKNLPEGVFHHTTRLKQLILDSNQLQTLRKCIFSRRTRLKTLSLVGNPLQCDCRLTWLLDLGDKGVTIWGTCGSSPARALMAVANPANYEAGACPFSSADCRF